MTEGFSGEQVPPRRTIPHYHGDAVRMLFIVGAVLIVFAQSTGAELPFSSLGAVMIAVALVIAAGITNPAQFWIHWLNAILAIAGTVVFGTTAVDHYRTGTAFSTLSFTYIEALAFISLIALYYTTRTIRGIKQRPSYTR